MSRLPLRWAAAALTLALALAGCELLQSVPGADTIGQIFSGESTDDGKPQPLASFAPEVVLERVWRAKIGSGLGRKYLRMKPAVVADRIYLADAYGLVEARDRFTGARLWAVRIGQPDRGPIYRVWDRRDPAFVTGGVGAGEGLVLVGTTHGEVVALDAGDGNELWRSAVTSEVLAPPVAAGDVVIAQTGNGRLLALEAEDGAARWSFDTQVPILSLRGTATPIVDSGAVFAGFATGKVGAVDLDTGAPIWEQRIMLPQGRSELDRVVDVDSTPVTERGLLFCVGYQGRLKAIRVQNGAVLWERDASSFLDLAQGYGNVYVVTEDDAIMAVNQLTSAVVWEQEALKHRQLTSPVAFDNYVLVGDSDGYMHVLAQSDGRFMGRGRLSGDLRSPMIEADDIIYIVTNDGTVEALKITRLPSAETS